MKLIQESGGKNDIAVNKKKSEILIIQNQKGKEEDVGGYPVKNWYKYLGVRLDHNLSTRVHIVKTKEKLEVYVRKNGWILKEYFSLMSLIQLCEYFQC